MTDQVNRRGFLKKAALGGGGLLIVAAGGVIYRAWDEGALGNLYDGQAFQPWKHFKNEQHQGPLALVAAAILAASPHNTQPWLFRVNEAEIDLFADPERNLGSADPYRREMYIGLGCALENLLIAARGRGYEPRLSLLPQPDDPAFVARVELRKGSVDPSAHFQAIAERHTNRSEFDRARKLPQPVLDAFNAQVKSEQTLLMVFDAESTEGKLFAEGTIEATEKFVADDEMLRDSDRWFRHSLAEVNRRRDGLAMTGFGLPDLTLRAALTLPQSWLGDFGKMWVDATRRNHCATAPKFGLIAVPSRTGYVQLAEAGRLWQRLHLEATVQGLAMQPLNQMMELADRDRVLNRDSEGARKLARMINDDGWQVVFGFRSGYAKLPGQPSPRRSVAQVTKTETARQH